MTARRESTGEEGGRRYHHGDLRRALIDTAAAMLAEEDGPRFTLREVARRAGVSHAAPYKHFPDKAALLAELALGGFDRLGAAMRAAVVAPGPRAFRREFLAIAKAYIDFGTANPALYRLMFGAGAESARDVHLNARALAALAVVHEFLGRGQQQGIVRRQALAGQAAACWAQVHGLTMLAIDGLLLAEKVGPDAVDTALAVLLEGIEAS